MPDFVVELVGTLPVKARALVCARDEATAIQLALEHGRASRDFWRGAPADGLTLPRDVRALKHWPAGDAERQAGPGSEADQAAPAAPPAEGLPEVRG